MMFDDDYFCTEIQLAAQKHLMKFDDIECNLILSRITSYLIVISLDNLTDSLKKLKEPAMNLHDTLKEVM